MGYYYSSSYDNLFERNSLLYEILLLELYLKIVKYGSNSWRQKYYCTVMSKAIFLQ